VATRFLLLNFVNYIQLKERRRVGALAMKVGMVAVWDKWAERHPATVLHLDECEVIQVKTLENDGYHSLQLGVGEAKPNRVNITTAGHYNKYGLKPKRHLGEFRVTPDALLSPGTKISAMHFVPGQVSNTDRHLSIRINIFHRPFNS
jgi:large subunit ribosomal protein L3